MSIYGYIRVSTKRQDPQRQKDLIMAKYEEIPEGNFFADKDTGANLDRPSWQKLMKIIRKGDTIVFDQASRMSRNGDEGFKAYRELYDKGVNLVFLKDPHINTDVFRQAYNNQIEANIKTGFEPTDDFTASLLKAVNKLIMDLAEQQVKLAFVQAEEELEHIHHCISTGLETKRASNRWVRDENGKKVLDSKGKPILIEHGSIAKTKLGVKLTTKKSIEAKKIIAEKLKKGGLTDAEIMKLAGVAKNTYYKYKRELKEEGEI